MVCTLSGINTLEILARDKIQQDFPGHNTMDMRVLLSVVTLMLMYPCVQGLGFEVDKEYWYDFHSTTHIKDASSILTSAKVCSLSVLFIKPLQLTTIQPSQFCSLFHYKHKLYAHSLLIVVGLLLCLRTQTACHSNYPQ